MKKFFQTILFLFIPYLLIAQSTTLQWLDDDSIIAGNDTVEVLAFEGGQYMDGSYLPYYFYSRNISIEEAENQEYEVSISNTTSSLITDISKINTSYISNDFKIISNVTSSRREYTLEVIIVPFKNENDDIIRLESFQLNVKSKPIIKLKSATSWFAEKSVLATGNWTKVGVKKTGVYKLTYSQLSDMGVTPSEVSVFTTTPGELSTMIQDYVDDLKEIPIYDGGDYILFYAQGPHVWHYNSSAQSYLHTVHPYWNENNFFITSDVGQKKRISPAEIVSGVATKNYTTFVDYDIIEPQEYSISHSGNDWYSDKLLNGNDFSHTFTFDNIVAESATMTMRLAARSVAATHVMKTYIDGVHKENVSLQRASNSTTAALAYETVKHYNFLPEGNTITASMLFESQENTAEGLVDYFSVEVKRYLEFNNKQLFFRNIPTDDAIVAYQLSNASAGTLLWDVTNAYDVKSVTASTANGDQSFNAVGNQVKEFVAINPSAALASPSIIEKVENQNIHGREVPDMVILTHENFKTVAEDLAKVHRKAGLDVFVTMQDKIFNEFSGGKADVTAIRWMMKMFYDRSSDFKYLLLLGDGDVNNRLYESGSSLVMTYQSEESLNQSETYVSDDYFGLLDDNEGNGSNIELSDKVDIGIGRIPITSVYEGNVVVNKIDKYMNSSKRSPWKNSVCLVADDEDNNTHSSDADKLAEKIRRENKGMAVKKVYIDAFKQIEDANGHYYPDAKKISDKYIEEGTLIWGYTGHGSPTSLSGEKMMYISDINAFENSANLPLWVTATCDFCPYDHNEEVSAGERVLLNPKGGGIALFTTTRLVYSSSNYVITNNFYNYILNTDSNGEKLRLGDVARLTKKATGTGANKRKFCLIGDPALQLIHPDARWSVETDSINYQYVDKYEHPFKDTLQALSTMIVSGYIEKSDGSVDTDFNGVLFPIVYDKISELKTLGNDANSSPMDFVMWNSTLYNGKTEVKNGRFTFSFLLPKDIDYTPGKGRIEYYATSDKIEANGFYEDFYIGGFNNDYVVDKVGPELKLYMNSPSFAEGGTVNPNPMFMADVADASGINTSGNAIGHDITLKLNNDPNSIEVINSSYATSVGDFTKGRVAYQLKDLDEGSYTLTLKIWDMQNNSSTKDISFVVKNDALPEIAAVYCYPNPVSLSSNEMVRFVAEHDRPEKSLTVNLNVFDSAGRLVHYSSQYSYSASNEVYFDWIPSSSALVAGLYFYRITIDDGVKISSGKSQKLILAQ